MSERKGEKIGWTGGWLGAFLWLGILSIIWITQGKVTQGVFGLALFILAVLFVTMFTPWRYPKMKYWQLLLPLYIILIIAVWGCISFEGGLKASGLNWWNLFLIIPMLIPFFTMGNRRWDDEIIK